MAGPNAMTHGTHEQREMWSAINDLREGQSAIRADVAAIRAVTDALGERRDAEVGAIWDKHGSVDERLRVVERDYTNKSLHDALDARVRSIEQRVWMGVGICAVINFLGIGGIAALVVWGGK